MAVIDGKKRCPKCGVTRPVAEWYTNKASHDGYTSWCRTCTRVWQRDNYRKNPEPVRLQAAEWKRSNPDRALDTDLRRLFGITLMEYERLLSKQGGLCAVCQIPPTSARRLQIDHDHSCCSRYGSCGKCVRGLLCGNCNSGIGFLKDSPSNLLAAHAYLIGREEQE